MAFSMGDFLSTDTADYTTTELNIKPQEEMPTMPSKNQVTLTAANGTPMVLNLNDTTNFTVNISMRDVNIDDGEIIMDFWASKTKGNGIARTFYWVHPTDGVTYVARFLNQPTYQQYPSIGHQGITSMTLFINAKK